MKPVVSNYTNANPALPDKSNNNLSFSGINAGKIKHLSKIETILGCWGDGFYETLKEKVGTDFIQMVDGGCTYKKASPVIDTLKYPFMDMPRDFLSFVANKFNIEGLKKSSLLVNYKKEKELKAYQRAMRGALQTGEECINEAVKAGISCETGRCNISGSCSSNDNLCKNVGLKFIKIFDENLAKTKAHYNTPHERTVARLASGITAATMMGNDFYNKSILNGKTDKEAKESAKKKRKQELLETAQEALSQYFMLGALASIVNNSPIAAPIVNTALGLLFKITSRLSTGRPLKRMKVPPKMEYNAPSINEYAELKKKKQDIKLKTTYKKEEKKKHLLSPKNSFSLPCKYNYRFER